MLVLFGILTIFTKKNTYYLPEGFTNNAETMPEYPTDALEEIKNPLIKIVKKLGNMTSYFANPQVWTEVYRTSQMSLTDLARENIRKTKEKQIDAAIKKPDTK